MRFSVWPSPQRPFSEIVETAAHAEATGWDGLYIADHFMPNTADDSPVDGPTVEALAVLAALASTTSRLRLGPLVCGNTYRHPAVLAKAAATIDNISGGRFVLGLGAGWQVNEHEAYGIPLFGTKERLDRFAEASAIVRGLLGPEPRFGFDGAHYKIADAPCDPKPVQQPLPLLVGGGGERRTLRIAAEHAHEWNVWGTPELLRQKGEVLAGHCEAVGRDPAEIRHSANAILYLSTDETWLATKREADVGRPTIVGNPGEVVDIVAAYADAGVDELIIPDFNLGPPSRRADVYDLFVTEVASQFR